MLDKVSLVVLYQNVAENVPLKDKESVIPSAVDSDEDYNEPSYRT